MACKFLCNQAIVVGGGLGGMSAANTVVENGGRVVLLDKSSFCGGNSTKATSGINGAGTKTQKAKNIPDTAEIFTQDTLKGGAKKPELAKLLCVNSAADVDWLVEKFNLDLSLVARLGGHSQPRTHRGKERFPGMTITYALIQMLEKVAEKTDLARIVTKAKVFKLVTEGNACVGCVYEKGGQNFQEFGPVILASGGFGADFTSNSLLAQYRPDLLHLPTTNGEHCTGDGIKMGEAIGAKSIDLEWVQVHPTGLVKPDDADAKIKFLAAEALRGVGGIILNAEGKRFCNELGRRDYVTGEMWKSKPPFRLCLNKAASDEIIWHCKHYTGRGVMKFYSSGEDLAKDMGVALEVIEQTHEEHYQAAKKTETQPDAGPWPAYPSGKSWDEASGKTGSGKKFYHNIIPGSAVKSEPFYVAIITPVIHYCMGGLLIDTDSACIGSNNLAIPGLYAAGEVAGGVHGNNRLGGNSLLDCVVFGRVAGKAAAKYMLGADMKDVDLREVTGGGLTGAVESSKLAGGSYEDKMNSAAVPAAAAAAPAAGGGGGGISLADVAKHNSKADCWVVVDGQVLDVTSFLSEHPGGELAILTFAGKDATEEFNMIHPPDVIGKYAPDSVIGMIGGGGGGGAVAGGAPAAGGAPGIPMTEVAKHNSKTDCWVVVDGQVLDVTSFLSEHPGGELAILTFAGKDATEEFNMIHPPDVIGKYAPDSVIGNVGSGVAAPVAGGAAKAGGAPARKDKGGALSNHQAWGHLDGDTHPNWRTDIDDNPGVFILNIKSYFNATWFLVLAMLYEVGATIFSAKNIKISNDRLGLTRSAILLVLFIVIHAVGNLHVFKGPDDFNGYGYFYVRLYWTGFGLPANIVEEYILLSVLLHVFVGLKRTWDMKLALVNSQGINVLNLAITGLMLLTFMTIHLFQFRFGDTDQFGPYYIRPPPYLINFWGILSLNLFWTDASYVEPVGVRDIYALEFQIFKNPLWSFFYIFSVGVFMIHACLGWKKVTPVLGIPRGHIARVEILGYAIMIIMGLVYISFPLYVMATKPFSGYEDSIQIPGRVE
ncbi:unnamed protein product [Cladocopium goreaui]|uniref:Cytochrome b5 heme-binding domain-containing protein n=1 Tax=Cladocopium goreaui TaxID=2562237 RepID=A0A9P1BML3_9DINO|nr:unnamed protein product [Cladocopium goreaui]CAI3975445.1 unnamed protein product [Cladocopium goreaui]